MGLAFFLNILNLFIKQKCVFVCKNNDHLRYSKLFLHLSSEYLTLYKATAFLRVFNYVQLGMFDLGYIQFGLDSINSCVQYIAVLNLCFLLFSYRKMGNCEKWSNRM